MEIQIPEQCLVFLIGATSAGKTTFAQRHFRPTEIVSSDTLRRWISDNENDQSASGDAFDLLHRLVSMRLKRGLFTVIDATNLHAADRSPLLRIARDHYIQPAAIVFDLPETLSQARNRSRSDRDVPPEVIHRHAQQVERSLAKLKTEGFAHIFRLESVAQVDAAEVRRLPLPPDYRERSGPFDIIGDVHGCADELEELLTLLGYTKTPPVFPAPWSTFHVRYTHPERRTAVFVGDIVDRGPHILRTVQIAFHMSASGDALAVPGNHDDKFLRWLHGHNVEIAHGLELTIAEYQEHATTLLEDLRPAFHVALQDFFDALPVHLVLDGGRLVVAHAGVKQRMIGRDARRVRDFALYGETHGETDANGLPIRYNWAVDYHGDAHIIYGHTPIPTPEWINNTLNIDTGCVYGGALTALRYPEMELVSVPARRVYSPPKRPIGAGVQPPPT